VTLITIKYSSLILYRLLPLCSSRKYPYSPTEGIGISWGVEDSGRPKYLKKYMKLNWNFQRGGKLSEKNPFRGGGMDIFWNYTFCIHTIL